MILSRFRCENLLSVFFLLLVVIPRFLICMNQEMAQVVFFDLDGTLCQPHPNYNQIFAESLSEVLKNESLSYESVYQAWLTALEQAGAMTTSSVLEAALTSFPLFQDYDFKQIANNLDAAYIPQLTLYEGVEELLQALLEKGYILGIISNGPLDTQMAVIRHLRIDHFFRHIVISGDSNIGMRKPNERIFQYALNLAQIPPERAHMIGDSLEKDILPTQRMGFQTFHINHKSSNSWNELLLHFGITLK